ncbi:MAG: cupin domain-containing protein [Deltaproteobacteria bacterium]|nr:cupin domain-containing protein [Deltaproteobacteria bacterium]
MTQPVSVNLARHYTWGQACDGWVLVGRDDLQIIEERMPPGATEERHYHQQARQFFYILAGHALLEVEGAAHELTTGQGLEIAPGQAHCIKNISGQDVRFLVVSHPKSHGDRVLIPPAPPFPPAPPG